MKYTEEHEWLRVDGETIVVGITATAVVQLGDLVFVELPEVGDEESKGAEIVAIESVKAASDIMAPLDGQIVAINDSIVDEPELVNSDPLDKGWFFKMKVADVSVVDEYMDEAAYKAMID